ncbi:ShlB/FhaC/HecB family hemolysin secretion/activation protein [Allosphingosinicella deserti]|nr:ShlB/FhaC/HecB family hemolysin secretion/activation protein [Sphingomonas deserti]
MTISLFAPAPGRSRSCAARLAAGLMTAGAILSSGAVNAQIAPGQLPSREQVQPPVPQTSRPPAEARVDGSRAFREVPCPFEQSNQQVALAGVRFVAPDGTTIAPELARLLAGVRAEEGARSVVQLCDLRDTANRLLRDAGYVASVQILPQDVSNGGELTLTVVTARLVRLDVEGRTGGHYARLIADRAAQLKAMDPFNERAAERLLLLAGDVPGLSVELSLSPAGTNPGDVIGTLRVSYRPIALIGNIQNFNGRSAGRETAYGRIEAYGLTGLSDVTYIGGSTTLDLDEQQVLQFGHSLGLNRDGARLDGSLTFAWSHPDLGGLDVGSRSMVGTLALSAPLERSLGRNAMATIGLDVIEQRTIATFAGTDIPLTRDKLRVGFARLSANLAKASHDGHGYTVSGAIELRQGLDVLGATERFDPGTYAGGYTPSNLRGDPTATVVRADLDGQIGLGPIFSLAAAGRVQVASDPLLSFEKFSIGSLTIGRGYDPGANSADSAIGLRGEVRAAAYRGQRASAEIFGFYDQAWLWNLDRFSTESGRGLASIGGGVRAALGGKFLLEAIYAHPLDRALRSDAPRSADRLLLSLTAQFSPPLR